MMLYKKALDDNSALLNSAVEALRKIEQLEQQLAQAREDLKDERKWKERIKGEALHYLSEQERLKEENAAMRALLERTVVALHGGYEAPEDELDVREAIEAFLAQQEPTL